MYTKVTVKHSSYLCTVQWYRRKKYRNPEKSRKI